MSTDLTLSRAPVEAEIATETPPAVQILKLSRALVVDSQDDCDFAAGILKTIKAEWKRIDARRKEFTGPAQDWIRIVNASCAPVLGAYAETEQVLKGKLAAYQVKVEQARTDAMIVAQPAPPPVEMASGISTRTVRKWRVTNPDKVPRQFCSPDPDKIKAHLAAGGLEAIPGVEFYDDQIVSVRT